MYQSSWAHIQNPFGRISNRHRPTLERLEPRLPPGDAMLGLLLAWSDSPLETSALNDDVRSAFDSTDLRAAGLIPAVHPTAHTAGINPAARHTVTSSASEPTSDLRAAGLIPAVYTAGTNPAARSAGVFNAERIIKDTSFAAPSFTRSAVGFSGGTVATPLLALRAGMHAGPTFENGTTEVDESHVMDNYGTLPLSFEANHGQTDANVDFIARTGGATVFLTPTAAVFSITQPSAEDNLANVEPLGRREHSEHVGLTHRRSPAATGAAIHMQLLGANPNASPVGEQRQSGIVNYFIGNDSSQWHANIPTFGRVQYADVYPGIDLAYYGNNGQLEYDFIVSPKADPNAITLNFAGADSAEINPQGDLVLHTAAGNLVQQKPFTYQEASNTRQEVASRYVLDGTQVSFEVGAYDTTQPIIIDPLVLGYSTFLGGVGGTDDGRGIAVDNGGNVFATGWTGSTQFPATPGGFDMTYAGQADSYVAKLNASGSALIYATYLGGSNTDNGFGIAVDDKGNAYVAGYTTSDNFPTTAGALDTTYNGYDGFVTKLSANGTTLIYSTYLGGNVYDYASGIALDSERNAYVTGTTSSHNFPTTPNAFDTAYNDSVGGTYSDAFVAKLNAGGTALVYSTYLGGNAFDRGYAISVDGGGHAYVTGHAGSDNFPTTPGAFDSTGDELTVEAFVTKVNVDGSALIYSTYVGGESGGDIGRGITVDSGGNAYVSGTTWSTDFPTSPGAIDVSHNGSSDLFVAKVNIDGSALVYATYIGGAGEDYAAGVALNSDGYAFVTGYTLSSDFPTTPFAFDTGDNGGEDAFMAKLNIVGTALVYSTYLGGSSPAPTGDYGSAIAVDNESNVYVVGQTYSSDFPTTPGAFDTTYNGGGDAFVTKFCERACRVPAEATQVVP